VVYEGSGSAYPPADEFDITIWDGAGVKWQTSPAFGQPFATETTTPPATNLTGFQYNINISGIPGYCDKTGTGYNLKIDGENVIYSSPAPSSSVWQTKTNVDLGISITDVGGAMVDGATIKYTTSSDEGQSWDFWSIVTGYSSAQNINPIAIATMGEGSHLAKWQAADSVGNGPVESAEYSFKVDTQNVEYSNAFPLLTDVSYQADVNIGIKIADITSGVDGSSIQYSTSADGGSSWSVWYDVSGYNDSSIVNVSIELTFPNGTENRIKWRASDIAGNGPMESPVTRVNVNTYTPPVKAPVALVSPGNNVEINTTSIKLVWELLNENVTNVDYDVLLDTTNPPEDVIATELTNTEFDVTDLSYNNTYYWTIVPNCPGAIGYCASGVWQFDVVPPDIKEPPVDPPIDPPIDPSDIKKIFSVDITGPNHISLYQGDNGTVELTITNLGNVNDSIKFEIDSGDLPSSLLEFDRTKISLISNNSGKKTLTIRLTNSVSTGLFDINITAISSGSGDLIQDSHIITVEINEKDEPPDTTKTPSEPESNIMMLLLMLVLFIIIAIVIVFFVMKKRRPEKVDPELLPPEDEQLQPGTFVAKPGLVAAPTIDMTPMEAPKEVAQLPQSIDAEVVPAAAAVAPEPAPTVKPPVLTEPRKLPGRVEDTMEPKAGSRKPLQQLQPQLSVQPAPEPQPEKPKTAADVLGIQMDAAAYEPPSAQPEAPQVEEEPPDVDLSGADTSGFVLEGGPKTVSKEAVEHGVVDRKVADFDFDAATRDLQTAKEVKATEESSVVHTGDTSVWRPDVRSKAAHSKEVLEQIEKLGELKEKGLITEQEFQVKKKELLG
jgi:hypothetical protein